MNISSYIRDVVSKPSERRGPYVTISRQYGASGIRLAEPLRQHLSQATGHKWEVVSREILEQAAEELETTPHVIEQRRREEPSLFGGLLESFSPGYVPSGITVRRTITAIIRKLAMQGHVIIVGQGGAPATQDIPLGLHVRIVAPTGWRIASLEDRYEISHEEASQRVHAAERERDYLRSLYDTRSPKDTAFQMVLDNSYFELGELVEMIVAAIRVKRLLAFE